MTYCCQDYCCNISKKTRSRKNVNKDDYRQREINGKKFVLEIFSERFKEGIVEICIPLVK